MVIPQFEHLYVGFMTKPMNNINESHPNGFSEDRKLDFLIIVKFMSSYKISITNSRFLFFTFKIPNNYLNSNFIQLKLK